LCDDCKERLTRNPLRLLDCKEISCHDLKKEAPQLVDYLDEESKQHFIMVLEYLDESEVPYVLNPYIVRGLDYYNRTAFEIWSSSDETKEKELPGNKALGGGGRFNGLIELLGGRPTPAVGVAFGIERLIEEIKKANPDYVSKEKPEVFFAQLGEEAAKRALSLFEKLRASGIKVAANFAKASLKPQLELADKLAVSFTVILGQKELLDGTIIIRDMENGIQEVVDIAKIDEELKKRLAKKIKKD
jgi:histidyl-tRNA synthetase